MPPTSDYGRANKYVALALGKNPSEITDADLPAIKEKLAALGDTLFPATSLRSALLADFSAYALAQDQVDALYLREDEWSHKAIINCLNMGYFSSYRSIREYADRIWAVKPVM